MVDNKTVQVPRGTPINSFFVVLTLLACAIPFVSLSFLTNTYQASHFLHLMLSELPLEILRRICTELSPEAALYFAHSCRHTYHSCDDWIVWRTIVKASAPVGNKLPAAGLGRGCKEEGRKMADTSAVRAGAALQDMSAIERYIPQLMTFGCKRRS